LYNLSVANQLHQGEIMNLEELYALSVSTVDMIEEYDTSKLTEDEIQLMYVLRERSMETAILAGLLSKLKSKYPIINLDVELFLEGVQID